MTSKDELCIGTITGAHGVHGAVRIRVYSDDVESILKYKTLKTSTGDIFTVKKLRLHKDNIVIVKFDEISNRNAAEEVSGVELFINRSQLPELDQEEFYINDLIGLRVRTSNGNEVGTIKTVENYGAGYFLTLHERPKASIPFTHVAVPEIHIKEGYIIIDEQALVEES